MALPTPRSYSQILGEMLSTFLARRELAALKVGSPLLTVMESSATAVARSTQDVFRMGSARSLEALSGRELDLAGAEDGRTRRQARVATGLVTITDSSLTKLSSRLAASAAAPGAGATALTVDSASGWPASGSVYVARGTDRYEGPLAYSSLTGNQVNLTDPTVLGHLVGDSVVVAQGGLRTVPSGTTLETGDGLNSQPVQFNTVFAVQLEDGETSMEGVLVAAQAPGVAGNVPASALRSFPSAPFTGATVTNPVGFSNGRNTESDPDYRDGIRRARATRAKGTDRAILDAVQGLSVADEAGTITSANLLRRENNLTQLVIDDGTGYEERSSGIAYEVLVAAAGGGEREVATTRQPIAQAFMSTGLSQPFSLATDARLALEVGGEVSEHAFLSTSFGSMSAATAYEVVASVNGNSALLFGARLIDGAQGAAFYARTEANDDLRLATPTQGTDARDALGLSDTHVFTTRLYLNDRLLVKDGAVAEVLSAPLSQWATLSGTQTLVLAVDGTPNATYSFTNASFVAADTGYTTVGRNSLAAWVAVFNAAIPGVTAEVYNGTIRLQSNKGRSDSAALTVVSGTLVSAGMFEAQTVTGATSDYTLNRQQGEILLTEALEAGDVLALGTTATRGFLESAELSTVTTASQAEFWLIVDGAAEAVAASINTTDDFTLTMVDSGAWGERWELSASVGTPFSELESGDWMVLWDSAVDAALQGVWRLTEGGTDTEIYFETPVSGATTPETFNFANADVRFVRSERQPELATLPAATYTADAVVAALAEAVPGATFSAYNTNTLRLATNTYATSGDVMLVAQDSVAEDFGFTIGTLAESTEGHVASVVSGNGDGTGTPAFAAAAILSESTGLDDVEATDAIDAHYLLVGERNLNDVGTERRWGNNSAFVSPVASKSTTSYTTRRDALQKWCETDRLFGAAPLAIGPNDTLTVAVDGDEQGQRFVVPMYRNLEAETGTSYGPTGAELVDADNGGADTDDAFGDFDFADCAVYMHSRVLFHKTLPADVATKRVLWRWKRLGADGDSARLRYDYPDAPDQDVSVGMEVLADPAGWDAHQSLLTTIYLPSGAERTKTLPSGNKVGYALSTPTGAINQVTVQLGFPVTSATRNGAGSVTLTLELATGAPAVILNHGLQAGDRIFVEVDTGAFVAGSKTITAVTFNSVTYAEAGAAIGATASMGKISVGAAPANFTGSGIVVGDILRIEDYANIPSLFRDRTMRVTRMNDHYLQAAVDVDGGSLSSTLTWQALGDVTQIKVYPLVSTTATALVAAVNALDASPVTGTVTGAGSGVISLSTRDEANTMTETDEWLALSDGVNYVAAYTAPNVFEFKNPVNTALTVDADWANEEVRIVPITAQRMAEWLAAPAVSSLSVSAQAQLAGSGRKVQLASRSLGSDASIEVQGGTANSLSLSVLGTGQAETGGTASRGAVQVATAQAESLGAGQWVRAQTTSSFVKPGVFTSTTALASSNGTTGEFVLSAGAVFTEPATALAAERCDITFQGDFCHLFLESAPTLVTEGLREGDYVALEATGGSALSGANEGVFRVVRVDDLGNVWYVNPLAVAESYRTANVRFVSSTSLVPGDTIDITSTAWGADKVGSWTVATVGVSGGDQYADDQRFTVTGTFVSNGAVAALGATEAAKFTVRSAPLSLYKRIAGVGADTDDATRTWVLFDTGELTGSIAASAGATLTVLDKLEFSSARSVGIDGYRYNTGLLAEANRVVYGDMTNDATYPGVASSGSRILVTGSSVRRVALSLALRVRSGAVPQDVLRRVRAEVAGVVNTWPVGKSIPLSQVVEAVERVSGVESTVVLAPAYALGSDRIELAANEKALIVDAETDVSLSVIGT